MNQTLCILISCMLLLFGSSMPAEITQPAADSAGYEAAVSLPEAVEEAPDPADAYLIYRMSLDPGAPYTPFAYENNPADYPKAMADAVVNPDAVFGFSPNPESTRLRDYVNALDWTNPAEVAEAREIRREYHESLQDLYRIIVDMLGEAKPVEEIARAVSQRRNEIRLEAYDGDPEGLALIKKSNLETYGDELGPSADSLYEKYGSWQMVLEKALGTNPGMDACLGFYDEYYELYDLPAE